MSYNGDNRRVISQQGATSTKFVWDATTDAYLSELNAANAVQAVYTNEPQQYGSVVSQRRSSTSHWLHADALGTTRLLTGSTQTTSDTYLLDAWGNPITSSGSTVNPFRWVGRYGYYQDASTGLVYVRARMYQPPSARWTSIDPRGFVDGLNATVYCHNDSVTRLDQSGFSCLSGGKCLLSPILPFREESGSLWPHETSFSDGRSYQESFLESISTGENALDYGRTMMHPEEISFTSRHSSVAMLPGSSNQMQDWQAGFLQQKKAVPRACAIARAACLTFAGNEGKKCIVRGAFMCSAVKIKTKCGNFAYTICLSAYVNACMVDYHVWVNCCEAATGVCIKTGIWPGGDGSWFDRIWRCRFGDGF